MLTSSMERLKIEGSMNSGHNFYGIVLQLSTSHPVFTNTTSNLHLLRPGHSFVLSKKSLHFFFRSRATPLENNEVVKSTAAAAAIRGVKRIRTSSADRFTR